MGTRLTAAVVFACLSQIAAAQTPAPILTRPQRELLQAIVLSADGAVNKPEDAGSPWQTHVMRASDGSHYVAFALEAANLPPTPVMLYVRLATAAPEGAPRLVERSAIREWLAGNRTDPRLLPQRNIAIGDMPMMGVGGNNTARPVTSTGSNELRLMAHERERQKQEKADNDKKRRAELEGRTTAARDLLPFEDFDLASQSVRPDGTRIVSRAFTAGPGDYDLILAWADPSAPKAAANIQVVRKSLRLLAARTAGLETSSIILADSVGLRAAPYPPSEQASHPYSIGLMEITPARTTRYSRDGRLSVAFQVINAESSDTGMPDVNVAFRIVRVAGDRESAVASLVPQVYNASTLPPDFNLRLGHPLFSAVTAPLATLARGDYRLKIVVSDRVSGTSANAETDFTVVGTPASLLTEAPSLGGTFTRDALLQPATLTAIVAPLAPASPSPALARALAIARTGKLIDLLVEEPVPPSESGVRTALTGLAFLSVGDSSAATHFQRALQQNAPAGPTQFLLGAARAAQLRDPDAIAAWQSALAAGSAPDLTRALLADAYLRRNDAAHAAEALAGITANGWSRTAAATLIGNHREADAVALLSTRLAEQNGDQDARWLLLHALYSQYVSGGKPLPPADVQRFTEHARAYIDAKGTNSALAADWLKAISS
jgi:hypothetical protein